MCTTVVNKFVVVRQDSMTDSMNFGPEWLRNLSSEAPSGGGTAMGSRYQLAEHRWVAIYWERQISKWICIRYGREEMLALYEKGLPAPPTLSNFPIYSEQALPPLALTTPTEEEVNFCVIYSVVCFSFIQQKICK